MPAISSNKPYRIGRSRTGLGLFATKPIKKGAKIIRYFGRLLDSKKKEHDEIENKYLFELNDRLAVKGHGPISKSAFSRRSVRLKRSRSKRPSPGKTRRSRVSIRRSSLVIAG